MGFFDNNENIRYDLMVLLALAVAIVIYLISSGTITSDNLGAMTNIANRFNQASNQASVESDYFTHGQLNLDPRASLLIEEMRTDFVNVGVARQDETSLLDKIVINQEKLASETDIDSEDLPWYYFSPNVAIESPKSYANKYRLVKQDSVNDFAWYESSGETLLFQGMELYTGWYRGENEASDYYIDGVRQNITVSPGEMDELLAHRDLLLTLVPQMPKHFFFVEYPFEYRQFSQIKPVNYSILYKAEDSIILSSPPRTKGSTLVTHTQSFYDMPMEVREEYSSFGEEWLHVYIGYEELGWVAKDHRYEDYVLTYYSEQELLDTIEAVIAEEISTIDADVGASFINNETMAQVDVNSHPFFPASTQKIYVLGELYHQYATGKLSPSDQVTLTDWDKVPGAGIIQGYPDGSTFTIDELVDLVAFYSDNTAANLIIDTVGGGENINPHIHQLGLYDTYVNGKYYHEGLDMVTTPHDSARFFALLYNNRVNGDPYDGMLIEKFHLNGHNFLRQYIYGDTRSWNKSGLGGTEQNDVATFVTPYGSYSIAVYTANPAYYHDISHQVGVLSERVHSVFNEIRSKLWMSIDNPDQHLQSMEETSTELEDQTAHELSEMDTDVGEAE